MRNALLFSAAFAAGACLAEVDSANVIGAIKVPTGSSQQLVAAAFAGYDGAAIKVDDMVATGGLANGSKLYVAKPDATGYYVWNLVNGGWQAANVVTIGAGGAKEDTGVLSGDVTVRPGTAFWVEPAAGSEAAYLIGQRPAAAVTTTTTAGVWNMIGNASVAAKTLTSSVLAAETGDRILIPSASGTTEYSYKAGDGKGWYYTTWAGGTPTKHYADPVIAAGAGFWYYSAKGRTINW